MERSKKDGLERSEVGRRGHLTVWMHVCPTSYDSRGTEPVDVRPQANPERTEAS